MRCAVHTADSCLKISVVLSFEKRAAVRCVPCSRSCNTYARAYGLWIAGTFQPSLSEKYKSPQDGVGFHRSLWFSNWKNVQRYGSSAPMILGFTRRGVRIADYGHCSTPVARNKPVRWIWKIHVNSSPREPLDWDGKFCQVPGRWSARSKGNQRQSAGIPGWGRSDPVPSRKKRGRACAQSLVRANGACTRKDAAS